MTPNIYPIANNHGTRFKAELREHGGRRVYLGTFDTRPLAEAAAAHYKLTGQKPRKSKTGPRGPHVRPRATRQPREQKPAPAPQPPPPRAVESRIAMMKRVLARL